MLILIFAAAIHVSRDPPTTYLPILRGATTSRAHAVPNRFASQFHPLQAANGLQTARGHHSCRFGFYQGDHFGLFS